MTFNRDYADALMMPRLLCSFVYGDTLVNEIECIPRNRIVKINKNDSSISYKTIDYDENSVEINTVEALDILDGWFYKWVDIIRSIKSKTNRISVDLTGGFDTRVIFALILSANIDMNSIIVFSILDEHHNHEEDFEIASQIADEFGFKLNQPIDAKSVNFKDMGDIINLSSYLKLGFSNQFNFKSSYYINPIYVINGFGGESIRGFPLGTVYENKQYMTRQAGRYNLSLKEPVSRILELGIERINQEGYNDSELQSRHYKETRLRNHFGKLALEFYLVNRFTLSPIIDPDLFKLKLTTDECDDNLLLITLIILRYCPKLLDFKVEGGRKFSDSTIEYAKKINDLKPFTPKSYELISGVEEAETIENQPDNDYISEEEINSHLKEVFKSKNFQDDFEKYIDPVFYEKISKSIDENEYFPLQDAIPAFSIVKVLNEISFNRQNNMDSISQWFDSFLDKPYVERQMSLDVTQMLRRFNTARIDLKNRGTAQNSIEIEEVSDLNSKIDAPQWFSDDKGIGHVIESSANKLDLKIRCIKTGTLSIRLRGVNAKDKDNNNFPIYIDFTSFKINSKTIFDDNHLACLDDFYEYKMDVNDSDVLDVHIEWIPFNDDSSYESKKIKSLENQLDKYKNENEELKNRLNAILNSKSGKLLNKFNKL